MLRLDLTHHPDAGDHGTIQYLGAVTITDDGTGEARTRHYKVSLSASDGGELLTARVLNWPQQYGLLLLVRVALESLEKKGLRYGTL